MNDVIKTIDKRRSTRAFKDVEISKEHKEMIIESAIKAPTAGNMVLYSIIDVTNENLKEQLSVLCDNQPFIKTAKLILLFVTNSNRWYYRRKIKNTKGNRSRRIFQKIPS